VRCRFAYGPADATATHYLLLQEIQIGFGFTVLVPAHPGSPGQNPESRKTAAAAAAAKAAAAAVVSSSHNILNNQI